ncbi:MAG: endonuclease/exonuclease/phosphatase family protein [Rhodobacteraceae bacterium]|nr:endonuclease/exonuclease/phosphatase family protein [Paracoccaceae bacterium]
MKILTWNIKRGGVSSDGIWQLINIEDPDIVLLQECKEIPNSFKEKYNIIKRKAVKKNLTKQSFETVLMSKYKMKEIIPYENEEVLSTMKKLDGNIIFSQVYTENEIFKIASVYLPAWGLNQDFIDKSLSDKIRSPLSKIAWSPSILSYSLAKIENFKNENWIIAGDFNLAETLSGRIGEISKTEFNKFRDVGLVDAISEVNKKQIPTFKNTNGGSVKHQIDYVFVTEKILSRVSECLVLNDKHVFEKKVSDHLPVLTIIK